MNATKNPTYTFILPKNPTYTFIQTYTFVNFQRKVPPIRLFPPILIIIFKEISHLCFYSEPSSIQNSRVLIWILKKNSGCFRPFYCPVCSFSKVSKLEKKFSRSLSPEISMLRLSLKVNLFFKSRILRAGPLFFPKIWGLVLYTTVLYSTILRVRVCMESMTLLHVTLNYNDVSNFKSQSWFEYHK